MLCTVEEKEIEEIHTSNILTQTAYWARIKEEQGFVPSGFHVTVTRDLLDPSCHKEVKVNDDLLVLIKHIDSKHSFAYVPYGPKLEPDFEHHGLFLEELSEVLKPHLPDNCTHIRYDLLWENQWARNDDYFDDAGNWTGPPPERTQELRVNFNTRNWNLLKSPGDILPKNTFFLDLRKEEHDLLCNMRANTRHNIRLAGKKGVTVREYGIDMLDEWYDLYQKTMSRNNMTLHPKENFVHLMKNQEDEHGIDVSLLMADYQDKHLASMFLVISNKRGFYLFGASTRDKKNHMASYALQWDAIRKAKQAGCVEYDMFGCAPSLDRSHPLYGVHLYKKGFGGNLFHRMGCWDYPFMQEEYMRVVAHEVNFSGKS